MPTNLIILGARGSATSVIEAVLRTNDLRGERYRLVGILDDLPENRGSATLGVPVLGAIDQAAQYSDCMFVNAIFSIASFRKVPEVIKRTGVPIERFVTIVDPTAVVSRAARIGRGCCIMACAYVAANTTVGDHVLVSPHVAVNHDASLGSCIGIASGVHINGHARVDDNVLIGGGAMIAPHVTIGASAVVGMGAVVLGDVPSGQVYAGNPARHVVKSPYNLIS